MSAAAVERLRAAVQFPAPVPVAVVLTRDDALEILAAIDNAEQSKAELTVLATPDAFAWIDKQGDVWRMGSDGLMHTPETAPFPREYVERKWGPLRPLVAP